MFDLENQIAQWRRETAKVVGRENGRLDELEGHLRDHIEQLVRAGAVPGEAFERAVRQLGDPGLVSAEFRKTRAEIWWPGRVALALWILHALVTGLYFTNKVLGVIGHDRMEPLLATHIYFILLGYPGAFLIGGVGICFVIQRLFLDGRSAVRIRWDRTNALLLPFSASFVGAGIVLGMLWSKKHWGTYWQWDPRETGGAGVFAWLVLMEVIRRRAKTGERWVMLAGIGGGIVTSLAWFGPMLVDVRYYGAKGMVGGALEGFILLHVAFLILGLLPSGILRRKGSIWHGH